MVYGCEFDIQYFDAALTTISINNRRRFSSGISMKNTNTLHDILNTCSLQGYLQVFDARRIFVRQNAKRMYPIKTRILNVTVRNKTENN